jgi:hypothetical protein
LLQLAGICAALVVLVLCTLLPFLPGRHDVLSMTLTVIAQGLGWAGLSLPPLGALWLAHTGLSRATGAAAQRLRHRYTLAALLWITVLVLLAVVLAAGQSGFALGIGIAAAWICFSWSAARRSRRGMQAVQPPGFAAPLACVAAPIALFLIQRAIAEPATELARDRAIENSAPLIADIERYRAERGHYPPSLHSLWDDYPTGVVGIPRYLYEPHGEAYNLLFEAPTFVIGANAIVVYNPRDEPTATSHDSDLLRFSGADFERRRGFFEVQTLPQPHWKAFLFD